VTALYVLLAIVNPEAVVVVIAVGHIAVFMQRIRNQNN
jgi:hypothetical protein